MDVSIIIPNYNTNDLVLKCIDSINKTTQGISYEIIVVDNASEDGSVGSLGKYAREKKNLYLIKNSKNLGFARAVNQGIKIGRGKYFLLLNSDTLVKSGMVKALIDFVANTPDAGVVGSQLLNIDGSVQPSVMNFPSIKNAVLEYWLGKKGAFELFVPKGDKPVEVDAVVGASFLITPMARKKVGLLDERYFMYFEDLDYCRRVNKLGLKVYYLPSAKIIHYHGASGKKIVKPAFQWKRLIPSSKIYHGALTHYLINFIIWLGQKIKKIF